MSKKAKQLENEPISYKATTIYTFQEFERFGKTISAKRLRICDYVVVITYLVIAAISFLQNNYSALLIYLIIIPIMMIGSRIFLKLGFKRIWNSNKDADGLETSFTSAIFAKRISLAIVLYDIATSRKSSKLILISI